MKQLNLRIDDDTYYEFREMCQKKGITMAAYLRQCIKETYTLGDVERLSEAMGKSIRKIKDILGAELGREIE